jgi:hypothetical protein
VSEVVDPLRSLNGIAKSFGSTSYRAAVSPMAAPTG